MGKARNRVWNAFNRFVVYLANSQFVSETSINISNEYFSGQSVLFGLTNEWTIIAEYLGVRFLLISVYKMKAANRNSKKLTWRKRYNFAIRPTKTMAFRPQTLSSVRVKRLGDRRGGLARFREFPKRRALNTIAQQRRRRRLAICSYWNLQIRCFRSSIRRGTTSSNKTHWVTNSSYWAKDAWKSRKPTKVRTND